MPCYVMSCYVMLCYVVLCLFRIRRTGVFAVDSIRLLADILPTMLPFMPFTIKYTVRIIYFFNSTFLWMHNFAHEQRKSLSNCWSLVSRAKQNNRPLDERLNFFIGS